MNLPTNDTYEARIRIENQIISSLTGTNIDVLIVHLCNECDLEQSGVEGEIVEIATEKIIYRCHKQTIIDQ